MFNFKLLTFIIVGAFARPQGDLEARPQTVHDFYPEFDTVLDHKPRYYLKQWYIMNTFNDNEDIRTGFVTSKAMTKKKLLDLIRSKGEEVVKCFAASKFDGPLVEAELVRSFNAMEDVLETCYGNYEEHKQQYSTPLFPVSEPKRDSNWRRFKVYEGVINKIKKCQKLDIAQWAEVIRPNPQFKTIQQDNDTIYLMKQGSVNERIDVFRHRCEKAIGLENDLELPLFNNEYKLLKAIYERFRDEKGLNDKLNTLHSFIKAYEKDAFKASQCFEGPYETIGFYVRAEWGKMFNGLQDILDRCDGIDKRVGDFNAFDLEWALESVERCDFDSELLRPIVDESHNYRLVKNAWERHCNRITNKYVYYY